MNKPTAEDHLHVDTAQAVVALVTSVTGGEPKNTLAILCTAYALAISLASSKSSEETQRQLIAMSVGALENGARNLLHLPPAH